MTDMTLIFIISGQRFGIDAKLVSAVRIAPEITRLPLSSDHIAGVCLVGSEIIPVVDLAKLLSISDGTDYKCAIVVASDAGKFAILADDIVEKVTCTLSPSASGSPDRLIKAFMDDKTAMIDVGLLVRIISRSAEDNT